MAAKSAERGDSLFAALSLVCDAMSFRGIWHSLAYGTLLGAVREGDLIPWDHDFDLIARPGDVPQILALNDELEQHDLRISTVRYPGASLAMNAGGVAWFDPMYLVIRRRGVAVGDIFLPSLFADGVLRRYDFATAVYWAPHFSIPHAFIADLTETRIRGRGFAAPQHAARFLTHVYGHDWRTPYRSVRDGGTPRAGRTTHSHRYDPVLRRSLDRLREQGADCSSYAGLPQWPRQIAGAGPVGPGPRAASTSGSLWWHNLDELAEHY